MSTHTRLYLSDSDREFLDNLIRAGKNPARTQMRARVLLATDYSQGAHIRDKDVADSLRVNVSTVSNIRKRYVRGGLDAALYDKPRPGAAPKITGEAEAYLIALACSEPPEGQTNWTLKLLADKLIELQYVESISTVAIHQHLKKAS